MKFQGGSPSDHLVEPAADPVCYYWPRHLLHHGLHLANSSHRVKTSDVAMMSNVFLSALISDRKPSSQ